MGAWALIIVALPLIAAGLSWLLGDRPASAWVSIAAGVGSLAASLVLVFGYDIDPGQNALGDVVHVDGLSGVFLLGVAFVYALVAVYSAGYLKPGIGHVRLRRLYWPLLNLFGLALLATPLVNDLAVLWVAVELTTVVSALLVTSEGQRRLARGRLEVRGDRLGRPRRRAVRDRAALPGRRPGSRPGLHPALHRAAPESPHQLSPTLTKAAFGLVVVGFGTKAGLVPMHAWLPDAHSEGPSPVSAMLSGALLATALYAVLRIGAICQGAAGTTYVRVLLIVFGALSLLLAALFALRQVNYKRLLAYSSIEHIGIVTLGVGIGGPDRRLRGVPSRPRPRCGQEPCLLRRRGAAQSLRHRVRRAGCAG